MSCRTCIHRLDVTLWGCWLATGCRLGLVLRSACEGWAPGGRVKTLEGVKAGNPAVPHAQKIPPLAEIQMARVGGAKAGQRAMA